MSNLETALVNACDVPELSELGEPGLKQPNRRGIIVHTVDFIFGEGNGYVRLGRNARIKTAVADVSDLETTLAAVLQKANSIIGVRSPRWKSAPSDARQPRQESDETDSR